ncbi:MAG: hypothetical protein AAF569_01985, partial [Pseudomonadota bacterium]
MILLAALTFAFTDSNRGGQNLISQAQADAYANQIMGYASDVNQAVKRLLLLGCDKTEISFDGAGGGLVYLNVNSPSDNSCHVFDTAGGGLSYNQLPTAALDSSASVEDRYGHSVYGYNLNIIGSSINNGSDYAVHVLVPFVNDPVCLAINEKFNNVQSIPQDTNGTSNYNSFFTTFSSGSLIDCEVSDYTGSNCGGS